MQDIIIIVLIIQPRQPIAVLEMSRFAVQTPLSPMLPLMGEGQWSWGRTVQLSAGGYKHSNCAMSHATSAGALQTHIDVL